MCTSRTANNSGLRLYSTYMYFVTNLNRVRPTVAFYGWNEVFLQKKGSFWFGRWRRLTNYATKLHQSGRDLAISNKIAKDLKIAMSHLEYGPRSSIKRMLNCGWFIINTEQIQHGWLRHLKNRCLITPPWMVRFGWNLVCLTETRNRMAAVSV